MKRDGFAGRLAYARWLNGTGRVLPESDAEFAKRADVGYGWLRKWMRRDDAPTDRHLTDRLVDTLGIDGKWLLDGEGEAPSPQLWKVWIGGESLVKRGPAPYHGEPVAKKSAKKRKGA